MEKEQSQQFDQRLSLKLFIVLNRALESVRKHVLEDIRQLGLNPTEFAVLELIYHKGDQPIQQIGKKVLIASSSITYVVDKLEKKALLKRKPCLKDRRITYATITDEGFQLMEDIFPKHKLAVQKICAGLNEDEKQIVIQLLKKLGHYAENL